jgi:hypothetical protein
MADYFLYSENYNDKAKMIQDIEAIAKVFECRIYKDKKDLYSKLRDIDIYFDIDEDNFFTISFWVVEEDVFKEDRIIHNSKDYFMAVFMTPGGKEYTKFGLFLKEFLALYPNMIFCDESCEIFHEANDVIQGKISYLEEDLEF